MISLEKFIWIPQINANKALQLKLKLVYYYIKTQKIK